MILLNAIISLLSEIGLYLCVLISIWMVDSRLGAMTLGLYVIKVIAELLIRREHAAKMKQLFDEADKL